ncbi:uncharacterized protein LOC128594590 isoform X1 [Nycticebus coucang]|uniref:uncharacterized protein LOC128594590 isoform X1 n=1 Tax=Nycticebus coucang TaxID=9470 RepID=UPI00234CA68C|nr:uncharacterized protein LOC128594590 isoform X1 [Nycticebus coucang]
MKTSSWHLPTALRPCLICSSPGRAPGPATLADPRPSLWVRKPPTAARGDRGAGWAAHAHCRLAPPRPWRGGGDPPAGGERGVVRRLDSEPAGHCGRGRRGWASRRAAAAPAGDPEPWPGLRGKESPVLWLDHTPGQDMLGTFSPETLLQIMERPNARDRGQISSCQKLKVGEAVATDSRREFIVVMKTQQEETSISKDHWDLPAGAMPRSHCRKNTSVATTGKQLCTWTMEAAYSGHAGNPRRLSHCPRR